MSRAPKNALVTGLALLRPIQIGRRKSAMVLALHLVVFTLGVQAAPQPNPPQDRPALQLNQPITKEIKGGQTHAYQLHSEKGMLVNIVAVQQGVDVAVLALDSSGKVLSRSDDSFGRVGPQPMEFLAEAAADYSIEVRARPNEVGGRYEISFVESRPITSSDRVRVQARAYITAGNADRSRASAESNAKALVEYEKALVLYKQIKDVAGQAQSLQYIGRIQETQSNYRKALEYYSSALPLWRQVKHRRAQALVLKAMGGMNVFLGNLDLALTLLQQAAEIHRETGNKEGEALAYHETANIHVQKGDVARGLEYFHRALSLYREDGTKNLLGYLLSNMGEVYRSIGDLKAAADYQNQALVIWRELGQRHGEATGALYLGAIYSELGETRKAISFYQEAYPRCIALEEKDCEARAYNFLASAYAGLGEMQTALDYYLKSAAIYRQRGQVLGLVRMLNSAGALYSSLGEKARALSFHNEALTLARKAQSKLDEAKTLTYLAELQADSGQTQKARELYLQALTISRGIQNRQGEATNLSRLGVLANAAGQRDEALKLFEQALAISNELGTKQSSGLALNNLGVLYAASNEPARAVDYFTRALTVFREIEDKNSEAMMLYRIASAQNELGKIDDARKNLVAALEIIETIRGQLANTDLRSSYFATVQDYYDLYIEILMRKHRAHPGQSFGLTALQISEQARARSLLDLLQEARTQAAPGIDKSLRAREKELLELINGKAAQQQQAFSDARKAALAKSLGEEISRLSEEYENLQGAIRQSNPRYAELSQARPLTLAQMQGLLDDRTVLLEYKLGNEHSYLWRVSPTRSKLFNCRPARKSKVWRKISICI